MPPHISHAPPPSRTSHSSGAAPTPPARLSVLAWPAWRRVLLVLPAVVLLWLAVAWANRAVAPW